MFFVRTKTRSHSFCHLFPPFPLVRSFPLPFFLLSTFSLSALILGHSHFAFLPCHLTSSLPQSPNNLLPEKMGLKVSCWTMVSAASTNRSARLWMLSSFLACNTAHTSRRVQHTLSKAISGSYRAGASPSFLGIQLLSLKQETLKEAFWPM